jgi:hypothetical protein
MLRVALYKMSIYSWPERETIFFAYIFKEGSIATIFFAYIFKEGSIAEIASVQITASGIGLDRQSYP